jgi:hypothetical protein
VLYLVFRLWNEDRTDALRVLVALAVFVLGSLPLGFVFLLVSLLHLGLLRPASQTTKDRAAAFWSSLFVGISNIIRLAAAGYILLQLWETFQ